MLHLFIVFQNLWISFEKLLFFAIFFNQSANVPLPNIRDTRVLCNLTFRILPISLRHLFSSLFRILYFVFVFLFLFLSQMALMSFQKRVVSSRPFHFKKMQQMYYVFDASELIRIGIICIFDGSFFFGIHCQRKNVCRPFFQRKHDHQGYDC